MYGYSSSECRVREERGSALTVLPVDDQTDTCESGTYSYSWSTNKC